MIEKLHLKNFTCFADNEFEFSGGINVFIGENGTGKTHLLKVLFSSLYYEKFYGLEKDFSKNFILTEVLGVDKIINLIKHKQRNDSAVTLSIHGLNSGFQFTNKGLIGSTKPIERVLPKVLFIPSKEILSFFFGFTAMYEKRETSFDATYNLLAKALELPPLKKEYAKNLDLPSFVTELEEMIGGQVINENGRFYIKTGDNKTEINLVAEGWRKIATLIYLILNGELELSKNMVLLIDEPEANLNPKLINVMAKFLVKLANRGVQIFVATHSYLLANYLSLYNEYKEVQTDTVPGIKFFGLSKKEDGIELETADSFTGLSSNAILEEYAAFLDLENQFIRQQMKVK